MTIFLRDIWPVVTTSSRDELTARMFGNTRDEYVDKIWDERESETPVSVGRWPMSRGAQLALPTLHEKMKPLQDAAVAAMRRKP